MIELSSSPKSLRQRSGRSWLFWLVLSFGLGNGVLYSLLLPLWEGFDEAFHYAYVRELANDHTIPARGRSTLPEEIWHSLLLVPVSHVVRKNISQLITFTDYFSLPAGKRRQLRAQLEAIPPNERALPAAGHPNYEAHQAPLAYCLLAVPDKLLSRFPLLVRVRVLRIAGVTSAILLTAGAVHVLAWQMGLPAIFAELTLFLTFSSQMFYGAVAHISNDWLAAPLFAWVVAAIVHLCSRPGLRAAFAVSVSLGLGLLTKAYFLALIPLVIAVCVCLVARKRLAAATGVCAILAIVLLAGPWYVRNMRVNKAFTGMQEEAAGVGLGRVASSAGKVPWMASIGYMSRASLWTGNASFTTFSGRTLNAILLLLTVGALCYLWDLRRRRGTAGDWILLSAIGLFIVALAYETVVQFVNTGGASAGASPWYMQVLLVPVLVVTARGLAASGYFGRVIAAAQTLLWAWVILATWVFKLIPQYGGYDLSRTRFQDVLRWYFKGGSSGDMLASAALCPPGSIYALVWVSGTLGTMLAVTFWRRLPWKARSITSNRAGSHPVKV